MNIDNIERAIELKASLTEINKNIESITNFAFSVSISISKNLIISSDYLKFDSALILEQTKILFIHALTKRRNEILQEIESL